MLAAEALDHDAHTHARVARSSCPAYKFMQLCNVQSYHVHYQYHREESNRAGRAGCTCNGLRACAAFCDDGVAHMAPGTDVNFDEVACCSSLVLHAGLDVCGTPFVCQLHSTQSVKSRTPLCVPAPSKRAMKASCPAAIATENQLEREAAADTA